MRDGPKGVFGRPPGSGVFWIRYKDADGREHREKVGPKRLAEQVYAKRIAEVAERKFFPEKAIRVRVVPLKDFLADFLKHHVTGKLKNADHEARYARLWTAAYGTKSVRALSKDNVARYVSGRADAGLSGASINRELAFLRKAMNHAVNERLADRNPVGARNGGVKLAKENNARVRYLTAEEETRLRDAIGEKHWPMVAFALHIGFRQHNQFTLKWSDVDFDTGSITARDPKGGRNYRVPMNATLRALLFSLPSRRCSLYVFPSSTGRTPLNSCNVMHRLFVPALERAEIADFTWHDLRHTFASRLVMRGVPLLTVSKLMGHETPTMTLRYAHLAPGHLLDAVRNLDAAPTASEAGEIQERVAPGAAPGIGRRKKPQWRRPESNRGPRDYETLALAN
jgi:integrase